MMKFIVRHSNDPYFNIAAEEHFLKNYNDDIIMIWRSKPSLIVGKHQNTMAESNILFLEQNNIPVIRRISGGGTVYHDEGNINYTIITSSKDREKLIDFKKFTQPIIEFLHTLGVTAIYEGKNNLTINGLKFSGNSAHIHKNRILNHGTLLFSTNLENLEKAIQPGNYSITDKGVKSIRATVTNIAEQLPIAMTIDNFINDLSDFFINYFNISTITNLSKDDYNNITALVVSKYSLWDWNFGYSPTYNYICEQNNNRLSMQIKKGIITNISLTCNNDYDEYISNILINKRYNIVEINDLLDTLNIFPDEIILYKLLFSIPVN